MNIILDTFGVIGKTFNKHEHFRVVIFFWKQNTFSLPLALNLHFLNIYDYGDFEYVGNITISTPSQQPIVVLGTGSANLWIPGNNCDLLAESFIKKFFLKPLYSAAEESYIISCDATPEPIDITIGNSTYSIKYVNYIVRVSFTLAHLFSLHLRNLKIAGVFFTSRPGVVNNKTYPITADFSALSPFSELFCSFL
ncbi:unnamed protein product [Angiostrongylus costaricensis]|uniref:Peptidase A1 domain-containing protein n=1 Tax=Angiostrongylus costaricensis TaxID=334426 RepID=A0A3P7JPZ3_ANGCS|nr:unnamed protein product [Angiostrongylus costaricensis]